MLGKDSASQPVASYPLQEYPPASGSPGGDYAPIVVGQDYPPAYPVYSQYPPGPQYPAPNPGYAPPVPLYSPPNPASLPAYPPPNLDDLPPLTPLAASRQIIMHPSASTVPDGIEIDEPVRGYERSYVLCVKLLQSSGDESCIVASAAVRYSPFLWERIMSLGLIPFLVNGCYRLNWPSYHSLFALITQPELQDTCDYVTSHISHQLRRVFLT